MYYHAVGHQIAGVFAGDSSGEFPVVCPDEKFLDGKSQLADHIRPEQKGYKGSHDNRLNLPFGEI